MKHTYLLTLAAFIVASPLFSYADEGHEHISLDNVPETTALNVNVKKNEAVVVVHGIVCSFCSYGVRKKVSKLDFVDHGRYKKGVHVDIENQRVTIAIKPESTLDLEKTYAEIQSGGYEPIKTYILDTNGNVVEVRLQRADSTLENERVN